MPSPRPPSPSIVSYHSDMQLHRGSSVPAAASEDEETCSAEDHDDEAGTNQNDF